MHAQRPSWPAALVTMLSWQWSPQQASATLKRMRPENTRVCHPSSQPDNRRRQQDTDKHLYQARHAVENFFAKLKQYRAIATRYDKTARNFLGGILLAASVIWLA
jgi:transposase